MFILERITICDVVVARACQGVSYGHAPHWGMHLIGVYLMGVHLIRVPHGRASYARIS